MQLCYWRFGRLPGCLRSPPLLNGLVAVRKIKCLSFSSPFLPFNNNAVENKCAIDDLWATVLHQLGVNHEELTYRYGGRDFRLTDVHGNVLRDILA